MQKVYIKGIGYFGSIYVTKKGKNRIRTKYSVTGKNMKTIKCGQRLHTHFLKEISTEGYLILMRDFDDTDPIIVNLEVKSL